MIFSKQKFKKKIKNGQFSFFDILQLPHTVISNSEKFTHPTVHSTAALVHSQVVCCSQLYTILLLWFILKQSAVVIFTTLLLWYTLMQLAVVSCTSHCYFSTLSSSQLQSTVNTLLLQYTLKQSAVVSGTHTAALVHIQEVSCSQRYSHCCFGTYSSSRLQSAVLTLLLWYTFKQSAVLTMLLWYTFKQSAVLTLLLWYIFKYSRLY